MPIKPTIFFDIDGVLADFVTGALKHHGKTLPIHQVTWGFPKLIGFADENDPEFWNPLGYDFWANLEPLDDGAQLLRFAEREVGETNVGFLTAPCASVGCIDGKREWVSKHYPKYRRRLFTGASKHLFASPTKILIDDRDENIGEFIVHKGLGVSVPRPWNKAARHPHHADLMQRGTFDVSSVIADITRAIDSAKSNAVLF